MSDISRTALFGKLDPILYKAIEGATVFCKLRGNPYVELVHWLHQLIQLNDSDLHRILRHYNIDQGRLATELTKALDALPAGATSLTDLSQHVESAVERGWVYSTLLYGDDRIRGGTLLVGMLKTPSLRSVLATAAASLAKLDADTLARELPSIVRGSPEDGLAANDGTRLTNAGAEAGVPGELDASKAQNALQRYAIDLTARARAGEIDPVTGRDEEIRQIIDILMRRRQNNPLLAGEAGVGKTAVVEGFALRLAQGDVPPQLKDVSLLMLDIGLLQAGAGIKGEFEQRLRQVIDEVQASPRPIIIFIDEAHTLIGAGGAAGTGDAANLLKPALARGTLRTIGATTWSEYKRHIEKDPALTRRFQLIQIGEPDETRAIAMVRGIADTLEKHHGVHLLDEAIAAAVRLSYRYIPARQLPDKAVSLLDTACARVAISQHAPPAAVEDCQRRIEILRTELAIIERESAIGLDVAERETACRAQLEQFEAQLQELETRWQRERDLANRLFELRSVLRQEHAAETAAPPEEGTSPPTSNEATPSPGEAPSDDVPPSDATAAEPSEEQLAEHSRLHLELIELQGEDPLVHPAVDAAAVASVVADWTGIPVGRMVRNEIEAVLNLVDTLDRRIVSQRHALERIASRVQTSRAKLDNPDKPVGVFLLVGPSGVGKTETALALADTLYGGEHNLITLNMSEFQEAHTVSTLKGAPPGYVGYGEGGVLTEAVRRKPHSVVLLDEIEKAHPDVHEIFFQVFDKGWMEDGEGRHIDFRNTIILLTSNVGTDRVMALARDVEQIPTPETLSDALRKPLLEVFPPAFLGRLVVIPYYPLANDSLALIVKLQLDRIRQRIVEQHGIGFDYEPAAIELVIRRCTELDSGARMIDSILTHTVLPHISREFLSRLAAGRPLRGILLTAADSDFTYQFESEEVLS